MDPRVPELKFATHHSTKTEAKDFVCINFPQMAKLFLETLIHTVAPMLANGDFLSPLILEGRLGCGF